MAFPMIKLHCITEKYINEMPLEEKAKVSSRGLVLKKLLEYLEK
jgi:inosine/xanthosine triphosphate pyrophosphatase family protein